MRWAFLVLPFLLVMMLRPLVATADWGFDRQPFRYEDEYYSGSSTDGGPGPMISLDLDAKNELNVSFRIAAREERIEEVAQDLHGGADVNSRSDTGVTALMYASRTCMRPMIELLLRAGADPNLVDRDGRSALIYATQESCQDGVALLLKLRGLRWDLRDHGGRAALDYARDMALTEVDGPAVEVLARLGRAANHHGSVQPREHRVLVGSPMTLQ